MDLMLGLIFLMHILVKRFFFDAVHDLVETPLEESRDVLVHEESPSFGFHDIVLPNPLDHSHVSLTCSQPSIFPEYSSNAPFDNPEICNSTVDLGHDDNEFYVLGRNVHDYLSLY